MTKEWTIQTPDGVSLYAKLDAPASPRGTAVIVHGLCEHQGRYDYVTKLLNEAGFTVYRFDHRGHGRSGGPRVYYETPTDMIDDVNLVVETALKEAPGKPLFVIGHSMGGYAAAHYATAHPGKVKGYVLSGAWTRDTFGLCENTPSGQDPKTYVENALGSGVCSDPAVVKAYAEDPYVEKQISLGLFYTCAQGHKWMKENVDRFTDPVLFLHGGKDGLVSPQDSIQCFSEIPAEDKSLQIYAGLFHEIFNEPCRDRIIGDAIRWMVDRL